MACRSALFERFGVLTERELKARYGIYHDNYVNTLNIEALTMIEMSKRQILPAIISYTNFLSSSLNSLKETGLALDVSLQADIIHLLKKLQEERGLSLLLISHDLPMVEHISDRIVKL